MIISFFPLRIRHSDWRIAVVLGVCLASSGCGQLGYYAQAVRGQVDLLGKRQPVSALLESEDTDADLKRQLKLAQRLREFGLDRLGLEHNRTFTQYADLGRRHVVWNLVAAPRYSVAPRTWCFPIAGCIAYKGYFREQAARDAALASQRAGDDVFVYGVSAYSTLGWFEDPLLNTFIYFREPELAAMIFHELTHQVVYFKDDSEFNEAFATAVEYALVDEWFTAQGNIAALDRLRERRRRHNRITEMVLDYRDRLSAVYLEPVSDADKARRKSALFDAMRSQYSILRGEGQGTGFYDWWFAQPLGNAHLLTVSTYFRLVPAISALIVARDGDLQAFFRDVQLKGPGIIGPDDADPGD